MLSVCASAASALSISAFYRELRCLCCLLDSFPYTRASLLCIRVRTQYDRWQLLGSSFVCFVVVYVKHWTLWSPTDFSEDVNFGGFSASIFWRSSLTCQFVAYSTWPEMNASVLWWNRKCVKLSRFLELLKNTLSQILGRVLYFITADKKRYF